MSRRRRPIKNKVVKDPIYNDAVVSKFINYVMLDGKKAIAENIAYEALQSLAKLAHKEPLVAFYEALENTKPSVEVRSRRIGGSNYQIPVEVRASRSVSLGLKWIIAAARSRSEKGMAVRLGNELFDATNLKGGAVKKKEDTHRMAEANRAFAHYRW